MATPSSAPHNSVDEDIQNRDDEVIKPINEVRTDDRMELQKASSPSAFMNSEPIREDQVENAVKFLSHPKVRGSPVVHRRSFLEKKGLTKEEIDEAFRRVPDPSSSTQNPTVNQDERMTEDRTSPMIRQRVDTQALNPASVATNGIKTQSWYRWYHAVIGIGLFTVSGAGTALVITNFLIPRLASWIRKVVQHEENSTARTVMRNAAEEAAVAAAAASVEVSRANQELLKSIIEEKKHFEKFMNLLDLQTQEIKSLSAAINSLKGSRRLGGVSEEENNLFPVSHSMLKHSDGASTLNALPAEPLSFAPHSKSYMEIMSTVERGERPPHIRDINDQLPNPNLSSKTKPWETNNLQENGSNVPWWQKKRAFVSEIESIGSSNDSQSNHQKVERSWVPPQPPPVMMPDAAEAIRRPKTQAPNDEKPVSDSSQVETQEEQSTV